MNHRMYWVLAGYVTLSAAFGVCDRTIAAAERPNVLWLTSEDNGPHLGCYGDDYATSPNIDALAARGIRYLNCWSTAPVCAPARTTLISGLYPPSTGAEHMRSEVNLPDDFLMYPQYLRQAGYYCTNNSKEDYNVTSTSPAWDESSRKAHWKNRKSDQPFFSVFNYTVSHESQLRKRPHTAVHDPAGVRVPAYHPDTAEVRRDWAQYYDKITDMDDEVGAALRELDDAGLTDSTIVFYYGDHGSGMPRNKRWPYNSGLRVPLVISIPEKFRSLAPADYAPGGATDRLVGFIDFAPTLLSLTGIKPPDHFQGFAFLGGHAAPEQPFIYGFRGRMDERYDMVRVARDKRYIYIRNYMPHKIYGQFIDYMFQTPTTQVWKRMFDEGRLSRAQSHFWQTKPPEELYDLTEDPDEIHNLAGSAAHKEILDRLRTAQRDLALRIRDVGFLPEDELHLRSAGSSPYAVGHDPAAYPLEAILPMAERAAELEPSAVPGLIEGLGATDSAVRYWAALGLLMRQAAGVNAARDPLHKALHDASPSVRVIAAQALGQHGDDKDVAGALPVLMSHARLDKNTVYVAMLALNAIDALGERAKPIADQIHELPRKHESVPKRMGSYVGNLINKTLSDLK